MAVYGFVLIFGFSLSMLSVRSSEGCPTTADCACLNNEATCRVDNTSLPTFLPSEVGSMRLVINGNRRISMLQDGGFDGLKLTDLAIHGTGITHLTCEVFKGLGPSLKNLKLTNNFISNVSSCALRGMPSLETLDLSYNRLTKLTANTFPELPALTTLLLRNNGIFHVEERTFSFKSGLNILDLRYNSLTSSVWSALNSSQPYVGALNTLYLSGNPLEVASTDFLSSLPYLHSLSLRNCSLKSFSWEDFNMKKYYFRAVDLSDNLLAQFGTDNTPVTLGYDGPDFNISFNRIKTFNVNFTWAVTCSSRRILASGNDLTTAIVNVYPKHSATTHLELDFSDNRVESAIDLSIQTDVYVNIDLTINLDKNGMHTVTTFPLNVKRIEFDEISLWDPCTTSKSALINIDVRKLSLRGNTIVNIDPRACLSVAKHVDLSGNQLTKLDRISTALEQRIRTLDVSHNLIKDVCTKNIDRTLTVLDLSDNRITGVPDFSSILTRKGFDMLNLTGNPIRCDCSIYWVRLGDFSDKMTEVLCKTPEDKVGQNMLSVDLFKCDPANFQRIVANGCQQSEENEETYGRGLVIFLGVMAGIFLLTTIGLAVIVYLARYRPKCLAAIWRQGQGKSDANSHVYEEATSPRDSYLNVSEGLPENVAAEGTYDGYLHPR